MVFAFIFINFVFESSPTKKQWIFAKINTCESWEINLGTCFSFYTNSYDNGVNTDNVTPLMFSSKVYSCLM